MNTRSLQPAPDAGRKPRGFKRKSGIWSTVCDSQFVGRLRTRRARRTLVVGFLLLLASMPLIGWLTTEMWIVILLFVPYLVGSILIAATTYGMLDRPMSSLDERQQEMRRSLFREPYLTGAAIGLLSGIILVAGYEADEPLMMGILLSVLGVFFLTPSMVLAWKLADESTHEG